MLTRLANHIAEMEQPQAHKYKVLSEARGKGYLIGFDVLYAAIGEDIDREIGEKEGQYIRELKPVLNYQIPKAEDYKHYTVNRAAKYIRLEDIIIDNIKQ